MRAFFIILTIFVISISCTQDELLYRDIPKSTGVINAYKKAHQLSDIRWTPKDYIPTVSKSQGFKPNVEYKGLWYSSAKEPNKFVGCDISIETAMTALNNPYSLLYTEDILEQRSTSRYGYVWHGTNCGAYMGVVCNSFVAYVLGFNIPWPTKDYPILCRRGVLQEIPSYDIQLLQLMDIVYEEGHVAVVTDIWRNELGEVVKVEISEAVYDNVVSRVYNRVQYRDRIWSPMFKALYRYVDIDNNIEYKVSPYVSILDDPIVAPIYNDDICTFIGDYAIFRKDDRIIINYTKGKYTTLEIYDETKLLYNVELSKNADNHSLDLSSLIISDGIYRARLTNGNTQSEYTHFEVRDIYVQTVGNIYSLDIFYSSPNAIPIYVDIVDRQSYPVAIYELTPTDIACGFCNICIPKLETWDGTYSGDELYIKVAFKTAYGTIYSHPIKV